MASPNAIAGAKEQRFLFNSSTSPVSRLPYGAIDTVYARRDCQLPIDEHLQPHESSYVTWYCWIRYVAKQESQGLHLHFKSTRSWQGSE